MSTNSDALVRTRAHQVNFAKEHRIISAKTAVRETTLPSPSVAPVHASASDLQRRETQDVSSQLRPPPTSGSSASRLSPSPNPRSPSPYLGSSGSESSSSEEESMLMNGSKPVNIQHIQRLMEELFSSDSTSSDSEENMETVLSAVLKDPLEDSMEGIEDLATSILRTGKLSVQGEAGDMSKLQPILLGLQASDREVPQLLPQLMQVPFFEQVELDERPWFMPEDFLACGHIRLGLPIDAAIYHLLHHHCAKGARQAEAVIQLSQTIDYMKKLGAYNSLPALICSSSVNSPPSPPLLESLEVPHMTSINTEDLLTFKVRTRCSRDSGIDTKYPQQQQQGNGLQRTLRDQSGSSLASKLSFYSHLSSTSSLPMVRSGSVDTGGERINTINENSELQGTPSRKVSQDSVSSAHRMRKQTAIKHPSFSGSEISDDGNYSSLSRMSSSSQICCDRNQWNVTIVDNNTIVGMFGDTTYPLLTWSPKLRLNFEISAPTGVPAVVVGVDPTNPTLNIRLHNPTSSRVGFSIRAHRQTHVHSSHVIYPTHGLHVLEPDQCWEENPDIPIHQESPEKSEYVIVELFFATLEGSKPSWNVQRKYAVVKANKRPRKSSRGTSVFQMPGAAEKKHDNLKQVIAHGLQCVVKKKHSAAEIIFTQALFLPDFQRIELKAFIYICLAVVAYRRQKAGEIESLTPAMNLVNSVDKLIEACEAPRTIRMPRTVLLVKQLKKELNFSDAVKNARKKDHRKHRRLVSHYHTEGSTTVMCEEGGFLRHGSQASLLVPRGSLRSETEVTLSSHDQRQLQAMLASSGWERTVQIVGAVHVGADTSTGRFRQPVQIQTTFKEEHVRQQRSRRTNISSSASLSSLKASSSPSSPLLLLHSNYLRKWDDITRDPASSVSLSEEGTVSITTDRTGWLAVARVDPDPARIASMAMQALSISPMSLEVRVFGQRFPDDVVQITVMMSPAREGSGDESCQGERRPSVGGNLEPHGKGIVDHMQISFPYVIEAYPGEQVRCQLKGCFEPDPNSGESDLDFHFKATQSRETLREKFVRLTIPLENCRGGKLVISRHLPSAAADSSERWEDIADMSIHLSSFSCRGSYKGRGSSRHSRVAESHQQ